MQRAVFHFTLAERSFKQRTILNSKIKEKSRFTILRISWCPEGPHILCLRGEAAPFTSKEPLYTSPSLLSFKELCIFYYWPGRLMQATELSRWPPKTRKDRKIVCVFLLQSLTCNHLPTLKGRLWNSITLIWWTIDSYPMVIHCCFLFFKKKISVAKQRINIVAL